MSSVLGMKRDWQCKRYIRKVLAWFRLGLLSGRRRKISKCKED